MRMYTWIPSIVKKPCDVISDPKVLEAQWAASLAEPRSSRLNERGCLRKQGAE